MVIYCNDQSFDNLTPYENSFDISRFNLNTYFQIIVHQLFYSLFISKLLNLHIVCDKFFGKGPFLHGTLYV